MFNPVGHWWTRFGVYLDQTSAVFGFLLISGYSIAASIERSSDGFYWRRFWRIFPTYVASIVLGVAASFLIADKLTTPDGSFSFVPTNAYEVGIALLMLQTFVGPTISANAQLWTVAIEWWEYMLAPLFKRCGSLLLGAFVILSFAAHFFWGYPAWAYKSMYGHMFIVLTWFWLVGFLYYRHRNTPLGYAILLVPFMVAIVIRLWIGEAVIFGIAGLLVCDRIKLPARMIAILNWLGELSYPIYAVHVPIVVFFLYFHAVMPAVAALTSILVSITILHSVDLPLRAWGNAHIGRSKMASKVELF
jgi:peptidoglycan/LPS O-acetylase OafA/YrhL